MDKITMTVRNLDFTIQSWGPAVVYQRGESQEEDRFFFTVLTGEDNDKLSFGGSIEKEFIEITSFDFDDIEIEVEYPEDDNPIINKFSEMLKS